MNMASFDPLTPTCDSYTAVVPSVLQANMDGMAMALAQKSTAADAWSTIFQKPAAKAWSAVNVAIKPNANPEVRVRVAILDKICKELNKLGVPYGNIIIYDMINMYFSGQAYALFVGNGLPSGVQISGGGGGDPIGGKQSVAVPAPYNQNGNCSTKLANGTIDILVNVASCKGHDPSFGSTTMTMKTHFGTFDPVHDTNFLFGINKTDAIVGGNPVRQQLCIVDAIWSETGGPRGIADKDTNSLVMGVCSPVVDYLTIKNIREQAPMNCSHNETVVDRFLSEFGFSAGSLTWVNVPPGGGTITPGPKPAKPAGLNVSIK